MTLTKHRRGSASTKLAKRPAPSSISELARDDSTRLALENDVFARVAENLIYLRRFRDFTQRDVARRMKTSQAAIARIEGARENITLRTLAKAITCLKGRLQLSIAPAERHFPILPEWWDLFAGSVEATSPYRCKLIAKQEGEPIRLMAGWTTGVEDSIRTVKQIVAAPTTSLAASALPPTPLPQLRPTENDVADGA